MYTKLSKISSSDINKEISIIGYVHTIRDQKKIYFVLIRQQHVILQCCAKEEELLKYIQNIECESIVEVKGILKLRNESQINLSMQLGKYELYITSFKLIQKPYKSIDIRGCADWSDENMNKERYIALRSNVVYDKVLFFSDVSQTIRSFLLKRDFVELVLPNLAPLPGTGAAVFQVHSQHFPDSVFSLSQSPQIFKQLLMIGDSKNYFSMAKCFRDESSRSDRVKEFIQCDVEMGAVSSSKDIMTLGEELVRELFKKYLPNFNIRLETWSFKRALAEYGSDYVNLNVIDEYNLKVENETIIINNRDNIYNVIKEKGEDIQYYDKEKNLICFHRSNHGIYRILNTSALQYKSKDISCVWLVDVPMYEVDSMGEKSFTHNPFCKTKHVEIIEGKEEIIADQYDFLLCGFEIFGGSIRENNANKLVEQLKNVGYSDERIYTEFEALINGYKYGSLLHGGFGLGVERLCTLLDGIKNFNIESIRNYIVFPQKQDGSSSMLNMPQKK
ncbi:Aspartate--tRNA(Asp/Asn) ligase [bacterium AB1]|nr:Aspartate--tRNA(Asp/Asn) ligase [bacterium AB1]